MPAGSYVRCGVMKETGKFYKGLPIYWKCTKGLGHDGNHKDTKTTPAEWEPESE